jgi:hypothetical protein
MGRTLFFGGLFVDASATAFSLFDAILYGSSELWIACIPSAVLGCWRVASALHTDHLPEVLHAERFLAGG